MKLSGRINLHFYKANKKAESSPRRPTALKTKKKKLFCELIGIAYGGL